MKVTTRPVIDRLAGPPYRQTPCNEPYKPGDEVDFRARALSGRMRWFSGQVWAKGPPARYSHAPDPHTYWVTDGRAFHEVHRSDLRLIHARDHQNVRSDREREAS